MSEARELHEQNMKHIKELANENTELANENTRVKRQRTLPPLPPAKLSQKHNALSPLGTSYQSTTKNMNDEKIEKEFQTTTRTFTLPLSMSSSSQKLTYPTINTDDTVMVDMASSLQNAKEVANFHESILRAMVEMRERLKLMDRDIQAEAQSIFNWKNNTSEPDLSSV